MPIEVSAGRSAAAPQGVDLSGHWKINTALSDDAERMLQKRLQEEREEMQKRRAQQERRMRAEGGIPPLPDGNDDAIPAPNTTPGASTSERPPNRSAQSSRQRRDETLRRMLGMSKTLEITQSGVTLGINSEVEARRFEAGTRSQVSMPEGQLADATSGWDGEWFVIERKARHGPRVTEKYRRVSKTDQLESFIAWSGDTLLAGMKVKRVYDRVAGTVAPPDPALGPVR